MKIYTSPNSPFGARVTIAARAKGLDLEALPLPAGGLRSSEYLAVNPIAKIPVLVTETGTVIPESEAILHYLEDRFPTPSLRPRDPDQAARVNIAIRIMDAYVMAPIIRTFPHLNAATRDQAVVDQEAARWKDGLASLAHFMATPLPDADGGLTFADCALPVGLHLNARIAGMLELDQNPMKAHPALVDYYERMKAHPIVGPVLNGLTVAQTASDAKAGRPSVAHWH